MPAAGNAEAFPGGAAAVAAGRVPRPAPARSRPPGAPRGLRQLLVDLLLVLTQGAVLIAQLLQSGLHLRELPLQLGKGRSVRGGGCARRATEAEGCHEGQGDGQSRQHVRRTRAGYAVHSFGSQVFEVSDQFAPDRHCAGTLSAAGCCGS